MHQPRAHHVVGDASNRYGSRHFLRDADRRIAAAKEHIDPSFDDLHSLLPIGAAPKSSNFKISTLKEALPPQSIKQRDELRCRPRQWVQAAKAIDPPRILCPCPATATRWSHHREHQEIRAASCTPSGSITAS